MATAVLARASAECAATATSCGYNGTAASCRNEYFFGGRNATMCFHQTIAEWKPYAQLLRAMEAAGNATLGGPGGESLWQNRAVASVDPARPKLAALQILGLARPTYAPEACLDADDLFTLTHDLNAECRQNASNVYCNVGIQRYPDPSVAHKSDDVIGASSRVPMSRPPLHAATRDTQWSVLDFGAVGDGEHDDTNAIQTALHFAGLATRGDYAGISQGGHASLQHPTLLFPRGTYRISRALHVNGGVDGSRPCDLKVHDTNQSCVCPAWLRGESALLMQSNASADILFNPDVWRWKVSGLHFVGGRNHIYAGNNDTDKSFVTVSDCLFANASSAAIRTMGPAWWDAAAAEDQGPYFRGTASTQFTVRSSQFYSNEQVAVNWVDQMVVEDVWVERAGPNGSYGKALFENHDRLYLSRMLGVPQPIAGNDQRWIDNYNHGVLGGTIVARDSRFGGEGGGFTVVVNYASFLCANAGVSKWASGMPGGCE